MFHLSQLKEGSKIVNSPQMYIFLLNYQPTELKKINNSNYFVEMEVFS